MKVYLAGAMTGLPEFNFPKFFEMAATLKLQGNDVFNPAEADGIDTSGMKGDPSEIPDFCLTTAMKRNIEAICDSEAIFMIQGWERSSGARIEHDLAVYLGLEVWYE